MPLLAALLVLGCLVAGLTASATGQPPVALRPIVTRLVLRVQQLLQHLLVLGGRYRQPPHSDLLPQRRAELRDAIVGLLVRRLVVALTALGSPPVVLAVAPPFVVGLVAERLRLRRRPTPLLVRRITLWLRALGLGPPVQVVAPAENPA